MFQSIRLNFRFISCSQGELEHRLPKARYIRTSRKLFINQLAQIERRQARLRRIRARHFQAGKPPNEEIPTTPEARYVIGKTQDHPEKIPLFLQKYAGDPALKVKSLSSDVNIISNRQLLGFRAQT